MFAVVVEQPGEHSALHYVPVPDPEPRPHDVIVRTRAAGVNRADLRFRLGAYGDADWGDSSLIGLEIAGDIVHVGPNAGAWKVGDRVMSVVGGGGYAELARVDGRMLIAIPTDLDYVQAAAIPEAFITAHESLCHLAGLIAGERVLIHAAGSSVGTAAIQLAVACNAHVAVTAGAAKLQRLRQLGAECCIDRAGVAFDQSARDWSCGEGVDVILDFIGGPYLERNIRALAPGGRLIQAGLLGGTGQAQLSLESFLINHLKMFGTVMKSRTLEDKCDMKDRFAKRWIDEFASGKLNAVVDKVYPISRAELAHQRIASNESFGKVVLTVPGE